ncbi:putative Radical SAM domain protein [Candidatus Microthrix parvicella RN1]|uniref:Putative Radical SAM domain protein n=2 Tax=Candidatus Neomicrothrix TaxID=41949 RepID=R4Z462_9ACTN|nr:putative Radical SAM domain protein [Candidatus Microthrix parvicella RN1]
MTNRTERVELERLKMSCLVDGIRIDPRALDHLTSSGTATLSVHEYPTTGGLTLQFAEHVFVNAPFDEWFCGDARAELQLRSDGVGAMFEGTWFHLVDVLPLPGYLDRTLPDGTAVSSLVHTHADRVRLSPLAGCAYDCGFCDLPGLAYVQKSTEQLLEALTVAMSDEALPPRHALISGGSPRRKHYESFIATCAEVIRQAPLPVDVMLSPMVDNVECIDQLADAGVAGLSINLELFAPESADSILGTKWRTTRDWFEGFVDRAVSRLGTNGAVRSLIIPGLESADDTIRGVEYLASLGCRPVLSPFRPARGIQLERRPPPSVDALTDILAASREIVARYGVTLGPRCVPCQHNTLTFPWDVQ